MQPNKLDTPFTVTGFRAAGIAAGIKKTQRPDLALVVSDRPCSAAAVFTSNKFPAAPVQYDRRLLSDHAEDIRAVLINAGCANACTGNEGLRNAAATAAQTETELGLPEGSVLVMSTGVIGQQLPMPKFQTGIPQVVERLREAGWQDAARAIMTTDTRPKMAHVVTEIAGSPVTLLGIAKGAGMIHPNMATLLVLVVTDAVIGVPTLQAAVQQAVQPSFNSITVDGDTSTNDTLAVLANGAAENPEIEEGQPAFETFVEDLTAMCMDLATQVVRDGEGATKFVTIEVKGAADDDDAKRVAKAVAHSPLVKTALYGGDANWGRILCAAGYSGAEIDPDLTSLWFAGHNPNKEATDEAASKPLQVVQGGQPTDYSEAVATEIFRSPEINIRLDLGLGSGQATVWTCDLSYDYVRINGDYRT